ncbi:NADPH-dependent codeinone reductase 1-4-like [Olea europaea var. sylvestris]|uniref:NADPH-dependent codeinone reductase 1-4-like n=1 Tax=Olea europaea var. sylvestris TaxID=158386 RepID=UPI000C1CD43F|nr:NADPH-dependent codeinone reductase 1-4-like [Olea europaea var. sylvestris]
MDTSSLQSSMPVIDLKSGSQKMPLLGFGTASDPPVDSETTKNAVLQAIELGYRHFDTAAFYNSEQPLGEAIAEALNRGLIKSRDEVFITSKLWCSDAHAQFVLPALQKTLK